MSGRHAIRGAISAWLGLIVLQAVVRPGGAVDSGRFGGFITDATGLLDRALSAKVAAIPDRRTGAGGTDTSQAGYLTPAQAQAAADAAAGLGALGALTSPGGALSNLPTLGQYTTGGLPTGISANPALNPALYPTTTPPAQVNTRALR